MPSKSKSQRAFLIRVVADKDYAKERKMSQDVARGILDEDDEQIAKDKHWADKLPDRAHSSSNESLAGDAWWNLEYRDLIVNQDIHRERLSLEGRVAEYVDAIKGKVYGFFRASSVLQGVPAKEEMSGTEIIDIIYATDRKVGSGMVELTSIAARLRMKSAPAPYWNGFIRQLTDYKTSLEAYLIKVEKYCKAAKAIYDRCERMQPAAAMAYATAEMKRIGLDAPGKPPFPMADFTIAVGPRGGTTTTPVLTTSFPVVVEHPTQAQLNQIIKLSEAIYNLLDDHDDQWTLDDTDEVKWWDHHFPNDDAHWGPMLSLFPCAGDIRGYDQETVRRSSELVVRTVAKIITMISSTSK